MPNLRALCLVAVGFLAISCGPNLTARAKDAGALRVKALAVKKGMSQDEVVKLIGEPDLRADGGFIYKHDQNGDDGLILKFENDSLTSISGMFEYRLEKF